MSRNTLWKVASLGALVLVFAIGLALASRDTPAPDSAAEAEAPLTEEQQKAAFVQQAMEVLRAAGEPRYAPEQFAIHTPGPDGGAGMTFFLANFYREYQAAAPERRAEVLARLAKANLTGDAPETYALVRPNLMLAVRSRPTFEFAVLPEGLRGAKPPVAWRPLGEVLAVALVQDTQDAMRYIRPEELEQWGVTFDQAYADGLANLRRRAVEPLTPLAYGTCALSTSDSYGASRLLLEDVVRRCQVKGEPVVLVPNRDTLLITGAQDAEGLRLVAELAERGLQAPRPVDGRALRLSGDGWKPFLPAPGSPSRALLQDLAVMSLARDYHEQAEYLNRLYEREDTDLFVASYLPESDEHGRTFGQAIWVSGIDTLLPRADILVFMDQSLGPKAPPLAVVRWDLVVRDAGLLLLPEPGLYPERYRVTGFPTPAQLQRWKAEPTAMDVP